MTAPDPAVLLHLVDRAEKGTILAPEVVALRHGIRQLADALEQARRTAGGLGAKVDQIARDRDRWHGLAISNQQQFEIQQQRATAAERERDAFRHQLTDRVAAAAVDCPQCPARAGRPCRAPSGQQTTYHARRRIAAQQAAATTEAPQGMREVPCSTAVLGALHSQQTMTHHGHTWQPQQGADEVWCPGQAAPVLRGADLGQTAGSIVRGPSYTEES